MAVYIKFWLIMAGIYYLLMFGWFIYGIKVMYHTLAVCPRENDEHGGLLDNPDFYDSVTLKILMFAILIIYWALVLLVIQLALFLCCIMSCWDGI